MSTTINNTNNNTNPNTWNCGCLAFSDQVEDLGIDVIKEELCPLCTVTQRESFHRIEASYRGEEMLGENRSEELAKLYLKEHTRVKKYYPTWVDELERLAALAIDAVNLSLLRAKNRAH